jgi:hypothetical protein
MVVKKFMVIYHIKCVTVGIKFIKINSFLVLLESKKSHSDSYLVIALNSVLRKYCSRMVTKLMAKTNHLPRNLIANSLNIEVDH